LAGDNPNVRVVGAEDFHPFLVGEVERSEDGATLKTVSDFTELPFMLAVMLVSAK
jgi:hypothetical protein